MALIYFENVGISAMAAAVPANTINNLDYTEHFSVEEAKQVVEKIGVYQRRFAQPGVCSSDLCYHAAEKLLSITILTV
jgi:3-oxoacyl-[acyl-carrier-protein] synthase-3